MVRNGLHLRTYSLRFKYLITIILTVERFQKGKKRIDMKMIHIQERTCCTINLDILLSNSSFTLTSRVINKMC